MSDLLNLIVAGVIAFVTGTSGTAIVNWVLHRQDRKAEAARQIQAEEKARELADKTRKDRAELLAAAQATAQTTALSSANSALDTVKAQCTDCQRRLSVVEAVCEQLVLATEAMLDEDNAPNRLAARNAAWAARRAI